MKRTVLLFCAWSLAGCSGGSSLLPSETSENTKVFQTYGQVETAYFAVMPGKTTTTQLAKLGFDVKTAPNIEVLTYVGVVDRLPQDAQSKGRIPMAVQACFKTQEQCTAYVFRPERAESRQVGNTMLELTGFAHDTLSTGWSAEVMLLVQNDVVVYKLMNGRPLMQDQHRKFQPLGPLQDAYANVTKQQD